MGGTPSTQQDLLSLKKNPPHADARKKAFKRLRHSMVPTLPDSQVRTLAAEISEERFAAWPLPPSSVTASACSPEILADRVLGCLVGAALGDAAGLAAEFLSKEDIRNFYGSDFDFCPGCEVYPDEHRMMWCSGDWTDDTDQQLLLLLSLLNQGGRVDQIDFARRLDIWRRRGFAEFGDQSAAGLGQTTKAVMNDKRFLEAPAEAAQAHSGKTPANGALMRTAVVGLLSYWDLDAVSNNAVAMCKVTHADPRCIASCVAAAVAVALMLQGADLSSLNLAEAVIEPALERASTYLGDDQESKAEFLGHTRAETLAELNLAESRRIGYTLKCLGAGFASLRTEAGFQSALNELIREGGDADTNGTVAGALLGCRLGYSRLPQHWIFGMPYSPWLLALGRKVQVAMGLSDQ